MEIVTIKTHTHTLSLTHGTHTYTMALAMAMQASKGQKLSYDDEMLPTINLFLTEYFNVPIL